MSRTHCPGSRRGHSWTELPGARGAELAKRVCRKCGAPGAVDAQGRIVLMLVAALALLSGCMTTSSRVTLPITPDEPPTRLGQAVLADRPEDDLIFTTSWAVNALRAPVTGLVVELEAGQATAQSEGLITIESWDLVPGTIYYLSDQIPGALVTAAPRIVVQIGTARSTTQLELDIQPPEAP